ncbi:hypothetical protein IPL68_05660 [Candidatus Saccharibacteria bacterium]|nr:MAG: hypothetical protein IPL68_05660 [Candidatus Saccharibacteria bacterium]
MDVNSLTQDLTNNVTSNVSDSLVAWVLVPSIIITVLFLVVFIGSIIRRRHIENAIFEIRNILGEMRDAQISSALEATERPK